MDVLVFHAHQARNPHVHARLLFGFLDRIGSGGLIHVAPAAGHGPPAVLFLHQQDFAILDDRGPGVDFRRLITRFVTEQVFYSVQIQSGFRRHDFGGNGPDALEALDVVGVFAPVQRRLRQGLKLSCPFEPLFLFNHSLCIFLKNCVPLRRGDSRGRCPATRGAGWQRCFLRSAGWSF